MPTARRLHTRGRAAIRGIFTVVVFLSFSSLLSSGFSAHKSDNFGSIRRPLQAKISEDQLLVLRESYGATNLRDGHVRVFPPPGLVTRVPRDVIDTPVTNSPRLNTAGSQQNPFDSPCVSLRLTPITDTVTDIHQNDMETSGKSRNTTHGTIVQRLQTLQRECGEGDRTSHVPSLKRRPSAFRVFLVDERRKYIFCFLPKVASTVWKRALGMLGETFDLPESVLGNKSARNPSAFVHRRGYIDKIGLKYLSDYNDAKEREHLLKTFYKFTFVRNPYERLLSAYRHKFMLPDTSNRNYYLVHYGYKIAQKYRSGNTHYAGNDVTFTEFLHYVIDEHEAGRAVDEHWDTYSNLCLPCSVQYDFIGKLESLQSDVTRVIDTLFNNTESLIQLFNPDFGPRAQRELGTNSSVRFREMYARVPLALLSRLQKIFGADAKMFGYGRLI